MSAPFTKLGRIRESVSQWLLQGISPQRLAVTLALGFVLGLIPVIGVPTGLCVVVAMAFRLNQPAIQLANYVAMPFQMALVVPLARFGGRLMPRFVHPALDLAALSRSPIQVLTHSSSRVAAQLGLLAGQAMLAWLLLAVPVAALLTLTLTRILRRVPVLVASESGD